MQRRPGNGGRDDKGSAQSRRTRHGVVLGEVTANSETSGPRPARPRRRRPDRALAGHEAMLAVVHEPQFGYRLLRPPQIVGATRVLYRPPPRESVFEGERGPFRDMWTKSQGEQD